MKGGLQRLGKATGLSRRVCKDLWNRAEEPTIVSFSRILEHTGGAQTIRGGAVDLIPIALAIQHARSEEGHTTKQAATLARIRHGRLTAIENARCKRVKVSEILTLLAPTPGVWRVTLPDGRVYVSTAEGFDLDMESLPR